MSLWPKGILEPMAVKTCGQCADRWVCEIHPDAEWQHHVDQAALLGDPIQEPPAHSRMKVPR
jgi:hypothetical protein